MLGLSEAHSRTDLSARQSEYVKRTFKQVEVSIETDELVVHTTEPFILRRKAQPDERGFQELHEVDTELK
jgi:hypothetical protein